MADRAYLTQAMPMCVIWGSDDQVIPVRHADNAAALAPDARVEVIPNAGHFPHKDHPQRFVKIVHDFIRSTQPATYSPRPLARAAEGRRRRRGDRLGQADGRRHGSATAGILHRSFATALERRLAACDASGVAALLLDAGDGGGVVDAVLLERLARPSPRSTSPASASAWSAWTTTDWASMWKNRRAAGRVSAKPKPSAPSTR